MLDKKVSAFGAEVAMAMNALENRLGARITIGTEEQRAAAADTDLRIDDVLKRLQRLETKEMKSDEGCDAAPRQQGGWRRLFIVCWVSCRTSRRRTWRIGAGFSSPASAARRSSASRRSRPRSMA